MDNNKKNVIEKPNEEVKWLGIISIVVGALAFITSWIPFVNNGSFGIAIVSLIISLIALFINLKNKKTFAMIGVIVSVISICIVLLTQSMYSKAFEDTLNTNSVKTSETKKPTIKENKKKVSSILNKTISVDNGKAELTVTNWKVIPAGETGNEYGDKAIIAFWYTAKNIKESEKEKFDPMSAWMVSGNIDIIQDNNKKQINTLNIGSSPDEKLEDTESQVIKKGASAEGAVSYELTDNTTPVTLKIYSSIINKDKDHLIAEQTFDIKK